MRLTTKTLDRVEVEYIDLDNDLVCMTDGVKLEIIGYYNSKGDECEREDAVALMAGHDDYGWIGVDIGDSIDES